MVEVYDAYGRSIRITREDWRTGMLPGTLRRHWDDPDTLYSLILNALNDGFEAEVLDAAEQLHRIDPIAERGATVLGIVLMKNGRLDGAERVLTAHTQRHGESGVILTNLAKVYAQRGDAMREDETLWRALQLDPNLENAVEWYMAKHRERGGEPAGLDAMRRVAELPTSWLAQLWLARAALESGDPAQALALYRQSLSRAGTDTPDRLLHQMSGDLGSHGLLREMVELTAPNFNAPRHGVVVGNNLIKGYLDLGQPDAARQVLEQLHALGRPDWEPVLSHWEREIAQAALAPVQPAADGGIPLTILRVDGPVWAMEEAIPGLLPAGESGGPIVGFLGSTAEKPGQAPGLESQLTDVPGRLSRAIPLFLAEQAGFTTTARVASLVPWVMLGRGAFGLGGEPWSDEEAARFACGDAEYVVVTHLRATREPWTVQLRLVRTRDAACVATLGAAFDSTSPEDGVRRLGDRLSKLLREQPGVEPRTPPPLYKLPGAGTFNSYLVRLEQLLAVRCLSMDGADPAGLSGTREMIAGNLQLCLDNPRNAVTRLLLAHTVRGLSETHPNSVRDLAGRVLLLQREHPLPPEAHGPVQRLLDEALST
jgi:tetratricopeptide (TPR) repeat protein